MTTVIPFLALLMLLGLPTLVASLHRKRLATFQPRLSHALVALLLSGLALLLGPSPSAWASSSHALGNKGASLLQGQVLNGDDYLESSNGQYVALMQDDGNFVLYHVSSTGSFTNPYWSTLTSIGQKGFAAMQTDGNLVLYHGTSSTPGTPYWASNTNAGAGSYHLDLQSDGDLVLYNGATALWASNTVASGSITFDGSTALYPLANAVANSYEKTYPGATINAKQSESGAGLSKVAAGTVDIGNSDIFANPTSYPGLVDHQVAVVVFTLVINSSVTGLKNLTSAQIQGIYSGKVTNWSAVGGPNLPIVTVSRPASSGTRATFDRFVLNGGIEVSGPRNLIASQSSAVTQNVQHTAGAIGYVSTFYAQQSGLQTLTIDGVSDDLANVENNSYKFWNLEHMYTKGAATGLADAFIKYMASNSPDVVAARQADGFIALSAMSSSAISAKQ